MMGCSADPLKPRIIDEFLDYAQARGFHVDPARKRRRRTRRASSGPYARKRGAVSREEDSRR
jgi:hypothetical protein